MRNKMLFRKILSLMLAIMLILLPVSEVSMAVINAAENATSNEKVYEHDGYTVVYKVASEWEGYRAIEVTLMNTGTKSITSWVLSIDNTGDMTGLWNAVLSETDADKYTVKCMDYNNTIQAGQSVTFGYTLEGADLLVPDDISMCSVESMLSEGFDVEYTVTGDWGTGFQGEIKIVNESEVAIEGWKLNFKGNFDVLNYWNCELTENADGTYTLSHTSWQNSISAGGEYVIGFVGSKTDDEMVISDVKMTVTRCGVGSGEIETDPTSPSEPETSPVVPTEPVTEPTTEIPTEPETSTTEPTTCEPTQPETKPTESTQPTQSETDPTVPSIPEEDIIWSDDVDTDGDGLPDGYEAYTLYTDPTQKDSDKDGISDGDEDFDEDGLKNISEFNLKTDPHYKDTDLDSLTDYDEVYIYNTSPILADTDSDGVSDYDEIILGLNPNNPMTNGKMDNEVTTAQVINADSDCVDKINSLKDNPYELSLDMICAGVAENNLYVGESGYVAEESNAALIGMPVTIDYPEELLLADMEVTFSLGDAIIENVSGEYAKYSSEFEGIKRFNIFYYYEDLNMLLPIETSYDENRNAICARFNERGTYCIIDMELWFKKLGIVFDDVEVEIQEAVADVDGYNRTQWADYLSVTILLDACGTNEQRFLEQKEMLKHFAANIYKYFGRANITIAYTEPGNDYSVGYNFFNRNYESFLEELDSIEYEYYENNEGLAKAHYYSTTLGSKFAPMSVLLIVRNTDYSSSFRMYGDFQYNAEIDCCLASLENSTVRCRNYDNGEEDSFTNFQSDEEVAETITEYICYNFKPDVYPYIFASNMEIVKNIDLTCSTYANKHDYDKDGIRDMDEVDLSNKLIKIDSAGYVTYPTLYECISMNDETYYSISRYLLAGGSKFWKQVNYIRVIPITSNPTKPDTDGDGFFDSAKYLKQLNKSERDKYFWIDDPHPMEKEIVMEWPVVYEDGSKADEITTGFTEIRGSSIHRALDISAILGTPVKAVYDGVVTNVGTGHSTMGNYIYISVVIGGKKYLTRYLHLESIDVTVGQKISIGQKIGTVGTTGRSGGPHLDYAIYMEDKIFVDPLLFNRIYDDDTRKLENYDMADSVFMNIPKTIKDSCTDASCFCCGKDMDLVRERYGLNNY